MGPDVFFGFFGGTAGRGAMPADEPVPARRHPSALGLGRTTAYVQSSFGINSPRIRSSNALAPPHQTRIAVEDKHLGRQRFGVKVRAHREPVGACAFDDQKVADGGFGQLASADEAPLVLSEDGATLAERAADRDCLAGTVRRAIGRGDRYGVVGAVEDGARVVVEPGVDQSEGVAAHALEAADLGEEEAALSDNLATATSVAYHNDHSPELVIKGVTPNLHHHVLADPSRAPCTYHPAVRAPQGH
jgi:hypothetical protein